MDKRLRKINNLLSCYSLGQFDKRLELSPRLDDIDAFIAGINMLGEELKAVTVSKNYFTNIFNTVSDMVFILDKKGNITDVNKTAAQQLGYETSELIGTFIEEYKGEDRKSFFSSILRELKKDKGVFWVDSALKSNTGKLIPVRLNAAYLIDEAGAKKNILLTAQDISLQLKTENLIIRAIIDTQEKERYRLAKDLHDSLGQQLSAIKFFVSTLAGAMDNEEEKKILIKSNDALTEVMTDMRNICFNLMPKTLEEFGLLQAVKEICNKTRYNNQIEFELQEPKNFPNLSKELQIDIYRVIQEFINNAIKHGKASRISIKFSLQKKNLKIELGDNGKGFTISQVLTKGMGLKNVQSRVKSHNGTVAIYSEKGKGTNYTLEIPINT